MDRTNIKTFNNELLISIAFSRKRRHFQSTHVPQFPKKIICHCCSNMFLDAIETKMNFNKYETREM